MLALVALFPILAALPADSVRGCDTEDLELRRTALRALMTSAPERLPALLNQLKTRRDPCSVQLRMEFVSRRVYPRLMNTQAGIAVHPSAGGRHTTLEFARDLAASDPDSMVRMAAIQALAGDQTDETVEALGRAARNAPTAQTRAMAVRTLTGLQSPRAHAERRAVYGALSDARTKLDMLRVIGSTDPDASTWLLNIAESKNEAIEVRREALNLTLRNRGHVAFGGRSVAMRAGSGGLLPTTPQLGELYWKLDDTTSRMQIIAALQMRTADPGAAQELARIVRNDKNQALRRSAVAGLQASRTEQAARLLAEIAAR